MRWTAEKDYYLVSRILIARLSNNAVDSYLFFFIGKRGGLEVESSKVKTMKKRIKKMKMRL
jgi:hypothetical protein